MSGAGSTLIAVAGATGLSVWLVLALRPWKRPQHAARYRPDPVALPALDDTVTFAKVAGTPPWDLAEEASARAALGELVFGTAGGMGCDSGAMAAVRDDLPGEDGPVSPPSGPAGAGCESEGPGLTAPPAPVPCPCGKQSCWLEELFRDPPRWLEGL